MGGVIIRERVEKGGGGLQERDGEEERKIKDRAEGRGENGKQ